MKHIVANMNAEMRSNSREKAPESIEHKNAMKTIDDSNDNITYGENSTLLIDLNGARGSVKSSMNRNQG